MIEPAAETEPVSTADSAPAAAKPARGITARSMIVSITFLALTTLWVRQAELIASVTNISETVPSMPAIGALLMIALAQGLGRRLPWFRDFSAAEKIVVYAFVSVGVMPLAQTWIRWLIPFQIIPFYFANAANKIAVWQQYLPAWLAPHDKEQIRQYYEGSPDGHVPWAAWLLPVAAWFVLLMLLWGTLSGCQVVWGAKREWQADSLPH